MIRSRKRVYRFFWRGLFFIFLLLNAIAALHAWRFTHFSGTASVRAGTQLSFTEKLRYLFTGVPLQRPESRIHPPVEYETVRIQSNKVIECWYLPSPAAAPGTVLICHGYGGEKGGMLDKAMAFRQMGYHTMLVDFMGSGNSEGNQTTIGYKEAEQVRDCVQYLRAKNKGPVILFGTSMGAAAIMRAASKGWVQPDAMILECPFGTMYETVAARFRQQSAPVFPMAGLLVFWGGLENGFWAFGHNPEAYAQSIRCPALLIWGEKDIKVGRAETDRIFINLQGPKDSLLIAGAGHENYLNRFRGLWMQKVATFLSAHAGETSPGPASQQRLKTAHH